MAAGFTPTESGYLKSALNLMRWMPKHDADINADPAGHEGRTIILDPADEDLLAGWALLRARLETLLAGEGGIAGGGGGPGSHHFLFTTPATVWTVHHNLGLHPAIATLDPVGNLIEGQVQYVDGNTLTVTFSNPETGSVWL